MEIRRAAGLWPRPRQAAAAERLRADDGADLVAVDIDVADLRARRDMRRDAVDARVDPQRQPIARGVDRVDQRVEFAALPRRDGPAGAENLATQGGGMVAGDDNRPGEIAAPGHVRSQKGERWTESKES